MVKQQIIKKRNQKIGMFDLPLGNRRIKRRRVILKG